MNQIESKYSFRALSGFLSKPETSISVRLTAGLPFTDTVTNHEYILSPINSNRSKPYFDTGLLPQIEYQLIDYHLQTLSSFVVVEARDNLFLVFQSHTLPERINSVSEEAISVILEFLNTDFGAEEVYLFAPDDELLKNGRALDGVIRRTLQEINLGIFPKKIVTPKNLSVIPEQILTAGPSISSLETTYVYEATKNGWNNKSSDFLVEFERTFADYVGAEFAMATSSCTGALHLALLALDIGPGDEVLVPDITWVATASAVRYVGAKPIFIDIDPITWTIDTLSVRKSISDKTKAIIPVHLYGYGARMKDLVEIASEYNLHIVEDAAPAIGTKINGKLAGTFGDFGCYSFQGAKMLVTGEGGMLVTNNAELHKRARKIQDHGRKSGTFWIEELGYKYKMNNITAALGLAQLQRSENQINRKRRINSWYYENLAGIVGLTPQIEDVGTKSICWMTSYTLDPALPISRDELIKTLKSFGVDSRPVFPSISRYEIWGYQPSTPLNSEFIGENGINLPSGVMLNRATVDRVCHLIREAIGC